MSNLMYRIIRLTLIATVLLTAYSAALVIYLVPYAWLVTVAVVVGVLSQRTYRYTAYGTARWAGPDDVAAPARRQRPERRGTRRSNAQQLPHQAPLQQDLRGSLPAFWAFQFPDAQAAAFEQVRDVIRPGPAGGAVAV